MKIKARFKLNIVLLAITVLDTACSGNGMVSREQFNLAKMAGITKISSDKITMVDLLTQSAIGERLPNSGINLIGLQQMSQSDFNCVVINEKNSRLAALPSSRP